MLICLGAVVIFSGCQNTNSQNTNLEESLEAVAESQTSDKVIISEDTYGQYKEEDLDSSYDSETATKVVMSGTSATITGSGATSEEGVIKITSGGTYLLTGEYQGQLLINVSKEETVQLVLAGVTITNESNAAIYVEQADKVITTLADGTINTLSDGETYQYKDEEADEPDAVLFSKDDLTINGGGELTVEGNYNNGIRTKDDLVIVESSLTVSAPNHAIKAKDSLSVLSGSFNLTAQTGDGIQVNNSQESDQGWIAIDGGTFVIQAGNDGIQAESSLKIADGDLTIKTASGATATDIDGASSYKGLKATGEIVIDQGNFLINSADDSIHGNDSITINGGQYTLSSGDDGLHADNDLVLNNAQMTITESYEGLEGATITINDGEYEVHATDDGINAAGGSDSSEEQGRFGGDTFGGGQPGQADESKQITINGGTIYIEAEGDGVDSNGNVSMTGGILLVDGPTSGGNGALDFDGEWVQTGGIIVAVGSDDMAEVPSENSSQASLGLYLDTTQAANTLVSATIDGETLFSYQPQKAFQHLVISAPELNEAETVTILTGGTRDESSTFHFTQDSPVADASELTTIALAGMVTSVDQSGNSVSGMGPGHGGGF